MIELFEPRPAAARELDALDLGILWPVVYASIFGSPVRLSSLHSRLVGVRASEEQMSHALSGPGLREYLVEDEGLVWLRSQDWQSLRRDFSRREAATRDLLSRNRRILSFVRGLPGVRLAALSGGCAHDAADDGDIDIFVVTEPGALWRTLLVATLVAKVRGWRRLLCLNYLVDATALAMPWRDFYGAFELISLKPLGGEETFRSLLRANAWIDPIFPNFLPSRLHGQNSVNRTIALPGARLLELTARMIHRPYLRYRLPDTAGVELSDHVVRLHATDHRTRLRGLFQDALRNIGVEAPSWI
ncbi:MAG: hypothetical protein K1Y01_07655 [Vicinamibacteria bacterium]|nr:hypothetical protein [Vicinamibacteria bacterium]